MASKSDDTELDPSASSLDETWFQKTRFGKFLSRPCVGSSLAYGGGAYFVTFFSSFGWTSSLFRANLHAIIAYTVVSLSANSICVYRLINKDMQQKSMNAKEKEEQEKREESLKKKIDERKRKHENIKRLQEQSVIVPDDSS